MKKLTKHIFYLLITIFFLGGCQSVKEGLTGQKKSNSDEFLIEKKNPLILPPKFDELPEPKTLTEKEKNDEEDIDLEKIIKKKVDINSISVDSNSNTTLEKSILEKIKKD
tara:strand:+ start:845 stop:1174 length:330 start_codon:yes stop_codon:yes gene_type:complete